MKKSLPLGGLALQKFLNFTEYLLFPIIHESIPKGVVIEKNISYGNPKEYERCNFIYRKQSVEDKVKQPLMIMIHGGGWMSGLKDLRNYYCYHAAQEGYFVANIDYCPAPQRIFPNQLRQIFKAIDFVLDNAEKYSIDTSKVVIAGESAGGNFVLAVSTIVKCKELFDKLNIEFSHRDSFDITAGICNCGAIDIVKLLDSGFPYIKTMVRCYTGLSIEEIREKALTEEIQLISPTAYMNKDFPPTMIIYGQHDPLRTESFALEAQLKQLGVPYKMYKGTGIL
ncbi:MAG: alpha/beta hydrolase, partial [Clostridia bacterium]|nr:alpha/beta hydrolase [Clostridia bacterium]